MPGSTPTQQQVDDAWDHYGFGTDGGSASRRSGAVAGVAPGRDAAVSAASFASDIWQGASRAPFPLAGVAATMLPWVAGVALVAAAGVIVGRRRRAAFRA